jgi:hypothetical protein
MMGRERKEKRTLPVNASFFLLGSLLFELNNHTPPKRHPGNELGPPTLDYTHKT